MLKFRQCHTVKEHVLDFAQHNARQNQRVAYVVAPFKRFHYVAAHNKSGNGNRFAEKLVDYCHHVGVQLRKLRLCLVYQLLNNRPCRYTGNKGKTALFRRYCIGKRKIELVTGVGNQSYAVFQLVKVAVVFRRGQLSLGVHVHFVRTVRKVLSRLCKAIRVKGFHKVNSGVCFKLRNKTKIGKSATEFCKSHRHDSHVLHGRIQRVQVGKRFAQHLAVIEPGAHYNLRVHAYSTVGKLLKQRHNVACARITQKFAADCIVRSMYRNIQRRKLFVQYARKLLVRKVGKRYKVARNKTEPPVVVLDVQCRALPLGQLVYKAKHALVGAPSRLDVALVVKIPAHWFVDVLFNAERQLFVAARYAHGKFRLGIEVGDIQHVNCRLPVKFHYEVVLFKTCFCRRRAALD